MTLSFPRLLRRLHPDLAHFLYAIPPGYRGRSVVTVHDLSFEHLSDVMGFKDRLLFRTQVPRSVRRADRVLTGSEWTKRDLIERYDLAAERIVVTPYGVDPVYRPEGPRADGHYALFVGAIQPRKDPLNALEALALVNGDLKLVLIGPDKLGGDRVREAVDRLGLQRARGMEGTRGAGTSWRISIAAPPCSSSRRGTRASGCPSSRRWRPGRPWSRRLRARFRRWPVTRPCSSSPAIRWRWPAASSGRSPTGNDSSQPGSSALAATRWAETARQTLEVYRELT